MEQLLLYLGPGVGMGTILMVLVVLLIVVASLIMIVWIPLKNLFLKIMHFFRNL
jgi:hypothetical protein